MQKASAFEESKRHGTDEWVRLESRYLESFRSENKVRIFTDLLGMCRHAH